jgi:hypothetical protein
VHLLEVGYKECTYSYNKCCKWPPWAWEYITEVTYATLREAYVWDLLKHFPLSMQYRYRFTTLLVGAQGLFTHPIVLHVIS